MKRTTIIIPILLPRLPDTAAVQLLDILDQLMACVHHHYAPQIQRRQRRQRELDAAARPASLLPIDDQLF